jgi:hypothetical protein
MSQEPRRSSIVSPSAAKAVTRAAARSWRLPTRLVLLMLTMPVLLVAAIISLPFILLGGSHAGAASPADLLRLYLYRFTL